MRKKIILTVAILLLSISVVYADSITKQIEVVFNAVTIMTDGRYIKTDNILYNGVTYVPLRVVSETLGNSVYWDEKTKIVSINKNYSYVIFKTPIKMYKYSKIFTDTDTEGNNTLYMDVNIVKDVASIQQADDFSNENPLFNITPITTTNTATTQSTTSNTTYTIPTVIQSKINGEFFGFSKGKTFELANGQIWKQTSNDKLDYDAKDNEVVKSTIDSITKSTREDLARRNMDFSSLLPQQIDKLSEPIIRQYTYNLSVLIYDEDGKFYMRVNPVDTVVTVERIK